MNKKFENLTKEEMRAVRNLLRYSWLPIKYDYRRLSVEEQRLISREGFDSLRNWVKGES